MKLRKLKAWHCTKQRQTTLDLRNINVAINNELFWKYYRSAKSFKVSELIQPWLGMLKLIFFVTPKSDRIALLRKIKDIRTLLYTSVLYYQCYILPFMNYCNLTWGSCNQENIDRIEKFQRCVTRRLNMKKKIVMVYKSLHGFSPLTRKKPLIIQTHTHGWWSTTSSVLFLNGGKTEFHRKVFSFIAAKQWNALPNYCFQV